MGKTEEMSTQCHQFKPGRHPEEDGLPDRTMSGHSQRTVTNTSVSEMTRWSDQKGQVRQLPILRHSAISYTVKDSGLYAYNCYQMVPELADYTTNVCSGLGRGVWNSK